MLFLPLLSFSQQRWEVTISNNNFDYSSIRFDKSYDQGYLLSAKTASNIDQIMKTDINGVVIWEKVYINDNLYTIHRIKQNDNGETLFCGIADNYAFLMFVDACGNLLWCNELISEHYSQSMQVDSNFY